MVENAPCGGRDNNLWCLTPQLDMATGASYHQG